ELIDADAERVLLIKKTENKTIKQYAFQFVNSEKYVAKLEALKALSDSAKTDTLAQLTLLRALYDSHFQIRKEALKYIDTTATFKNIFAPTIAKIATSDSLSIIRADAIEYLAKLHDTTYLPLFKNALNDSSYRCVVMALSGIEKLDTTLSTAKAKELLKEPDVELKSVCYGILSKRNDTSLNNLFQEKLIDETGYTKTGLFYHYANYLTHGDSATIASGINFIGNLAANDESKHDIKTAIEAIERVQIYLSKRTDAPFKKGIDALTKEWIDKLKKL
ncbi:MAG TPA: HEAT repeat domain-containing protein, partial [Chitinophagales bacterium]